MKVFISWSGPLSKGVAEILRPWIKCVLQATEPFISTEDIDKGAVWFNEISDQLAGTTIGVICLTRDNANAPWILFEAGSLARGLTKTRVCTFLVDLKPTDLQPPLSQFNATLPHKADMLRLLESINSNMDGRALPSEILKITFEQFWPSFESQFKALLQNHKMATNTPRRPVEDVLEEMLTLGRATHQNVQLLAEAIEQASTATISEKIAALAKTKAFKNRVEWERLAAEEKAKMAEESASPDWFAAMRKALGDPSPGTPSGTK